LPKDFDYVVEGSSASEFAKIVANECEGHYVSLDTVFDTARVVFNNSAYADFAGCVGENIEADIKRRDFTVNALLWDPTTPDKIVDFVDGLKDLESCLIRALAEQNFVDDPLRILRAFRMVAVLGGHIEKETHTMLSRHVRLISTVAAERISYELFQIMESPQAYPVIVQMGDIGILESIFPELSATKEVTPNSHHHLDLWHHSLELVRQAELIYKDLPLWANDSFCQELGSGISRLAATKIACLLHDIGKPSTWVITTEGRHTFYGHDKAGADMVGKIATRLKWSKPLERFITNMVRWHLRPGQLFHQGLPTKRAVHRFYRQLNNDIPELVLLSLADLASTCGPGIPKTERDYLQQNLIELLNGYCVFKDSEQKSVRLIDGNQIMKLLNIPASPLVGKLLSEVIEAQDLGEIATIEQAKELVLSLFSNQEDRDRI
jgi:putative nucleotidyltransferase with HDIG domain